MSSLTSLGYTATQYALLTSALTWSGKFLKGFSGAIVESLQHGRSLLDAYGLFYILSGAIGLPAIALCIWLAMVQTRPYPSPSGEGVAPVPPLPGRVSPEGRRVGNSGERHRRRG
jgi:MFS transporter, PAT family, beta-lactamase induction signal transducer AmpG